MPVLLQSLKRIQAPMIVAVALSFLTPVSGSEQDQLIAEKLAALEKQNDLLMHLVENQQSEIDALRTRLDGVTTTTARQSEDIEELQVSSFDAPASPARPSLGSSIHVSGEAGFAFHAGEANTNFPNEEFRMDEDGIFIDAQVAHSIYLFSEPKLLTRETDNPDLSIGELYLECGNFLAIGNWVRAVNLRLGKLDVPCGGEYQSTTLSNPQDSTAHSLNCSGI
ncbi:MAG: hypothetical protein O7C75_16180 [Verrucomicrobia bacterium]|nr:hypothetical protein [Verrucomicrobiota bacterium]